MPAPRKARLLLRLAIVAVATLYATPAVPQTTGLVAAWGFNEGSGTIAGDSSGRGHVGNVFAATWSPNGRFGGALSFNGLNSWVTVADSPALDFSTGMTLMAWIQPTTSSGIRDVIIKEGPGVDHYNLYHRNGHGLPESNVFVGGVNRTAEGTAVPTNTWTHLAGTYDGAVLRLFINGVQVSSTAQSGSIPSSSGPLRIGGNSLWGEFFEGLIDEVRVYDRALTTSEIQSEMGPPIGPPPPPPGSAQVGQWAGPFDWPLVAIHTMLLWTGEVLAWDAFHAGEPHLWNPVSGALTRLDSPAVDLFCSGHAMLPDGKVLVAGGHVSGHVGVTDVHLFDAATQRFTAASSMSFPRWYPTVTTLPDGRVLVTSGEDHCAGCRVEVPEVYDPTTQTWEQLTAARLSLPFYPFMFVLPDGRVLAAGSSETAMETWSLDLATRRWTVVHPTVLDGGSAVMFLPGKIMKSGTSANSDPPFVPAAATTYVLDMQQPAPAWRQTSSMARPRSYHNLTLLPDGTVLVTGGGVSTDNLDESWAVYEAELWSPVTETWTTMAMGQVPRLYHSTALLLPDGRVLVAGSGRQGPSQLSAEIYSPPYLFKGSRPTITSAPANVLHGSEFFVSTPDAARIASVSLIRPGAVTHAFNHEQRFLPLTFQATAGGLAVQAPANANLAPPGFYMLFIVADTGVPSIATFVRLPTLVADGQPPTRPDNLVAQGSVRAVSLSWANSTDNVGVTGYNVHRSTSSGFVPGPANRIAQTTATQFTDSGLSPGTYYYVVTASDSAGNVSTPSNEAVATATADTAAPLVQITAPAQAATVTGTISVTADASDNVAVSTVQFFLDGTPLGAPLAGPSYSTSWSTTASSNGSHTLSARATDASGNVGTSPNVTVTVSNSSGSGLVAAYAFGEASGSGVTDASGNGHTGTISGATRITNGRFGRALSFDGVNDWVTIPDSPGLDLSTGMTLMAWIFPTVSSGVRDIVIKEGAGIDVYNLYHRNGQGQPEANVLVGGTNRTAQGSALPINAWTHVAGTYDGATLRLFVNGIQAAITPISGQMPASTGPLRIGGNSVWGEFFRGRIDEVRVYNRALSQAEIQEAMNTALPVP